MSTRPPGGLSTASLTPARVESRHRDSVLRAIHPHDLAWSAGLGAAALVLGRGGEGGVSAIDHPTVSRAHARIEWQAEAGAHVVTDLRSRNGTRVDGIRAVEEGAVLRNGSVLRLGDVLLIYELEPDSAGRGRRVSLEEIPGASPAAVELRAQVGRAARDPSPVLVTGETGTGKERVARELHRLGGRRGPLVTVNCSALSRQIAESQLFGHQRGAFTGATTDHEGYFRAAHGGTLFLDEVGDLPTDLQPKLLRAVQEGEIQPVGATSVRTVDVRIVAATNRPLDEAVAAGRFRRDLYARLAMWEIHVPALSDRRGDIPSWIVRLHARWAEARPEQSKAPLRFTSDAMERLLLADWSENLRGLERLVHELAADFDGDQTVDVEDLPEVPARRASREKPTLDSIAPRPAEAKPREATTERESPKARAADPAPRTAAPSEAEFRAAFAELDGNVRALARRFGRDRTQIYRWMRAFGLSRET